VLGPPLCVDCSLISSMCTFLRRLKLVARPILEFGRGGERGKMLLMVKFYRKASLLSSYSYHGQASRGVLFGNLDDSGVNAACD
jgi:hypothetical protein